MEIKTVVFALVTFLHDVFTAVWMGGLFVTVLSVMPAVREALGPVPQVKKVMQAYQKRQSVWVYVSMAGLVITGLLMGNRSGQYLGLFGFGNVYTGVLSVKHILVLALIASTLYRTLVLGRAAGPLPPARERLNRQLLLLNVALALGVLFASALVAALGGTP